MMYVEREPRKVVAVQMDTVEKLLQHPLIQQGYEYEDKLFQAVGGVPRSMKHRRCYVLNFHGTLLEIEVNDYIVSSITGDKIKVMSPKKFKNKFAPALPEEL
jgi:hypothetical protein